MNQFFPNELIRNIIVGPTPPAPLSAYRIFSDENRVIFMAAKLEGDRITIIAEATDESVALDAILRDAWITVPVLERDMAYRGPSYQPKVSDWE